MLKEKEEQILGCVDLINKIIEEIKINKPSVTKEDLFQQGFIGLIEAINTYDKRNGNSFEEYASAYIKVSISKLLSKKHYNVIKKSKESVDVNGPIKVESLHPYFRMMDVRVVNILKMYFGFNNEEVDINYIAFVNCVSTSEVKSIIDDGLRQLKYLIEQANKKKSIISTHRKDDSKYTYYSDYMKEDIDRATILLTDKQKEIQALRFNKETATKQIKTTYVKKVHPRMLGYLKKIEDMGSWKDAYVEMELEKREKQKKKVKNNGK